MATVSRSARRGRRHKPCPICGKRHAPWWAARGRWQLSIKQRDGSYRTINLGQDHDEAIARWHRIEAGLEQVSQPSITSATATPVGTGDAILIGELIELFLANIQSKISASRFKNTRYYLGEFSRWIGAEPVAKLRVGGVARIEAWINSRETWRGCVPDVVSRIKQMFRWSSEEGFIPTSPVTRLVRPKYGQRVYYFSPAQVDAILANCGEHFARAFKVLLLTGCRPDEICSLTSDNVHEDETGLFLMIDHKNMKHTGKQRRVFLVPEAEQIIREQLKKYPTGALFRSGNKGHDGYPPLSCEYFTQALRKITAKPGCKRLGLNDFEKVGGKRMFKYVPYTARHTFAVRYLTGFYKDAKGKPIILNYGEVAVLLGNSAKMVEEIYGHLCDQTKFLSDRLNGRLE